MHENTSTQVRAFLTKWFLIRFFKKDGMALHLNKFGPPLSNNAMRKVWLVVAPWFVRRRRKCEKLKGRRGQRTNFDQKSSFEL